MFSNVELVLTDGGSRPYDISNDVMISAIWKIANYDISGTGHLISFMF